MSTADRDWYSPTAFAKAATAAICKLLRQEQQSDSVQRAPFGSTGAQYRRSACSKDRSDALVH